jgi:hypothetical protein
LPDFRTRQKVPVIHFSKVTPPFVVCVALDRTGVLRLRSLCLTASVAHADGELENNVKGLGLRQGIDFFFFN